VRKGFKDWVERKDCGGEKRSPRRVKKGKKKGFGSAVTTQRGRFGRPKEVGNVVRKVKEWTAKTNGPMGDRV